MALRHQGRHRRPTRKLPVRTVTRCALAITAAGAVSLGVASPALAHTGQHTVQAGDTLGQLAAAHGTSWQSVYAENRAVIGDDPNRLRIGQVLTIGGGAAPAAPSASGQASRGADRVVAAPVALLTGAPTPSSTSYASWAPHVRPVVAEVAGRFGVGTVLTRPGHSPSQELAADFMVHRDAAKGDAVAQYVIDNAARFRVDYVIWQQRIYLPSSGTWRAMADRGSPTANHMDHPHVSFLPAG
ncbi:LysM domain-containing protein [Modestobacter sp. VKM Ac-2986]|uniref:LysM peptidoglycan-binding domain-containing protein n=1 Tax=Modestobacter sp. VKM Ac-2986 TaxID=3004140 RepID=UPI0022AB06DF|nr:LysM domain-containing protein [Modestobacter sp. VKM Ac-2986]MCZ2829001.1 LysM domain-containing protein [Modestobacter sp. VKM Ac-2986]